jgi:hypothetical protein
MLGPGWADFGRMMGPWGGHGGGMGGAILGPPCPPPLGPMLGRSVAHYRPIMGRFWAHGARMLFYGPGERNT